MPAAVRRRGPARIRRRASIALFVAVAALAVPHPAAALVPIPPAPVRFPIADVGHAILTLAEQYTQVPVTDKGPLHNEMVLLINMGHAAI
ncbi:hypothetical protein [Terracoccus sp. 273MFTsu3.1]|uniref:hypothetical protein n=1 Tax=Terracoccus sp. 273MFTsu3.1 TaxID=1172188 RepID=UPI0012DC605F|nr:hypothetical protein [Terracoccus sp. 273MFTsu3.1]